VLVDLLTVLNDSWPAWSLKTCVILLPQLCQLLRSPDERFVEVALGSVRIILLGFSKVIRSGSSKIGSTIGTFNVSRAGYVEIGNSSFRCSQRTALPMIYFADGSITDVNSTVHLANNVTTAKCMPTVCGGANGTYAALDGLIGCVLCGINHTVSGNGLECQPCPVGAVALANVCVCAPGYKLSVNGSECQQCPAGTIGLGNVCVACNATSVAPLPGGVVCSLCASGSSNGTHCLPCGDGWYQTDQNSACIACTALSVEQFVSGQCQMWSTSGASAIGVVVSMQVVIIAIVTAVVCLIAKKRQQKLRSDDAKPFLRLADDANE